MNRTAGSGSMPGTVLTIQPPPRAAASGPEPGSCGPKRSGINFFSPVTNKSSGRGSWSQHRFPFSPSAVSKYRTPLVQQGRASSPNPPGRSSNPPTPLVEVRLPRGGEACVPPSWSGGIVVTPLSRGGRGGWFLSRRMNSSSRKKRPRPLSRFTSRRTLLIRVRSGGGGEPFFRFVRQGQAVYKKSGDCPLFPFPARGLKLIARTGTVCPITMEATNEQSPYSSSFTPPSPRASGSKARGQGKGLLLLGLLLSNFYFLMSAP